MPQLEALHRPRTVPEAVSLLERYGEAARPLAGGTALILALPSRVSALVDLGGIAALDFVDEDAGALRVGAMATCSRLRRVLERSAPESLLCEAVSSIGTRILQNHVTVGGNCVAVYGWSDLPVALLCLGGRIVVEGSGGARRELSAAELFAQPPARVLAPAEILVEVRVPALPPRTGGAYRKLTLNETDQAIATVAARARLAQDGTLSEVAVVAGALRGLPQPLEAPAEVLLGVAPDAAALAAAGRAAAEEARTAGDYRASAEYRTAVTASLAADALEAAIRRAGGAS